MNKQWSIKKTTNNLKIEQQVPHYKSVVNTNVPERQHNGCKRKGIRTNNDSHCVVCLEHLCSPPVYCGVRVAQSLDYL
jgi:hypothetical protein